MAWYAYCVAEKQAFPALARHRRPVPLEQVTGLAGNQVFLYPANELAVLVSEHGPEPLPGTPTPGVQGARDHARVIADCFQMATVLPFRFGTVFPSDEVLRRSVRLNQRDFLANLGRLHGKSEMHLKLTLEDRCREQVRGAFAGTAYRSHLSDLRESATLQRERQTRARSLSTQVHRMFAPVAEEISCRSLDSGEMQLDVSHLIASKQVERYQHKFALVREQMGGCRMQLSGPWPPYHFVHGLTRPRAAATQERAVPA